MKTLSPDHQTLARAVAREVGEHLIAMLSVAFERASRNLDAYLQSVEQLSDEPEGMTAFTGEDEPQTEDTEPGPPNTPGDAPLTRHVETSIRYPC